MGVRAGFVALQCHRCCCASDAELGEHAHTLTALAAVLPCVSVSALQIYTAAGWGGSPTTCAQGGFAHACSTRKMLLKLLRRR
jgi:hypothetical protein